MTLNEFEGWKMAQLTYRPGEAEKIDIITAEMTTFDAVAVGRDVILDPETELENTVVRFRFDGDEYVLDLQHPAAGDVGDMLARILQALERHFDTISQAISWVNEVPVPGYAGQTAITLIGQGRGQSVLNYLDAYRRGAHA